MFLYVPDLDYYIKNDRKLYFNINELPFIPVRSNDELASEITNFDGIKYEKDLGIFLIRLEALKKVSVVRN